jgi:hypothetical protein
MSEARGGLKFNLFLLHIGTKRSVLEHRKSYTHGAWTRNIVLRQSLALWWLVLKNKDPVTVFQMRVYDAFPEGSQFKDEFEETFKVEFLWKKASNTGFIEGVVYFIGLVARFLEIGQ